MMILAAALGAFFIHGACIAFAHGIGGRDAAFVAATKGPDLLPFMYLGAKHMVTGYDHLLFIFGVIFFLYRLRDVFIYVTLFSIGHSITLLAGVLLKIDVNAYLVDAIIGFSVAYKAFDNLGGFKSVFGVQPNNRVAVAGFGLIHGFGLATKLQSLRLNGNGLVANMIGFNIGVEIGQLIALAVFLRHHAAVAAQREFRALRGRGECTDFDGRIHAHRISARRLFRRRESLTWYVIWRPKDKFRSRLPRAPCWRSPAARSRWRR